MPDLDEVTQTQRLDKWLWHARVVKTRSLASQLVMKGKFRVNRGKTTKPAFMLKAGDVITTAIFGKLRILQVTAFSERRGPASEARTLYADLTPSEDGKSEAGTRSGTSPEDSPF